MGRRNITICMPEEAVAKLKRLAKKENRSVSGLVKQMLEEKYVIEAGKKGVVHFDDGE